MKDDKSDPRSPPDFGEGKTPPARLEDAENTIRDLGKTIRSAMPRGWGFSLQLWSFDGGEKGAMTYISNCERGDMIKALKEFTSKLESGEPEV